MKTNILSNASTTLSQMRYATMIASQNISNADNQSYSRSIVMFEMDPSGSIKATATRMSNFFLTDQLNQSNSDLNYYSGVSAMADSIDTILTGTTTDVDGNNTNPLNNSILSINNSLNSLSSSDTFSGRLSAVSSFEEMITAAKTSLSYVQDYSLQVEAEMASGAENLNALAKQLSNINKGLDKNKNDIDLLNQRDSILSDMSNYAKLDMYENESGSMNVKISGGYDLVTGTKSQEIKVVSDEFGLNSTLTLNGDDITNASLGGSIGSSITVRDDLITPAINEISKTILGYAAHLNSLNKDGFTSSGVPGGDIFNIPSVGALASKGNTGDGVLSIAIDELSISEMVSSEITMTVTPMGYEFTNKSSGEVIIEPTLPASVFGFNIQDSGTFDVGDSFLLNPLENMMNGTHVVVDGAGIAAAGSLPVEDGDNTNLINMSSSTSSSIFSGENSVIEQLSAAFVVIGSNSESFSKSLSTASSVNQNAQLRRDNLSGVSTQEEELNMMKFQQIYQSVSKVIEADSTMFNSILNAI